MDDASRIREERRRLRNEYRELYDAAAALLFRHDPAGINFETNTDEYEAEVGTILPRLRSATSADDVRRIVHEEFVRWFDTSTAGPERRYQQIAEENGHSGRLTGSMPEPGMGSGLIAKPR